MQEHLDGFYVSSLASYQIFWQKLIAKSLSRPRNTIYIHRSNPEKFLLPLSRFPSRGEKNKKVGQF